jgi:hypothetical protein
MQIPGQRARVRLGCAVSARARRRALTPSSRGQPTAAHVCVLCQHLWRRCLPLMSNVRPHRAMSSRLSTPHAPLVSGALQGNCNICLVFGPLTEDHVPPKGVLKVRQIDLFHIHDLLCTERPVGKRHSRHMQGGVFYRSICSRCNSTLLGARYDPSLIETANAVTDFLRSSMSLPQVVRIRTKPGLLARSVLGHLLAVGINRTEGTPLMDAVRQFVLDETRPLPEGIDIHYWVYPYRRQMALRDAALALDFFKTHIVVWCLKFFPLGFLVTWSNEHRDRLRVPSLRGFMLHSGVHDADVLFDLINVPHQFWPEAPTDQGALLIGEAAHGAISRAA